MLAENIAAGAPKTINQMHQTPLKIRLTSVQILLTTASLN